MSLGESSASSPLPPPPSSTDAASGLPLLLQVATHGNLEPTVGLCLELSSLLPQVSAPSNGVGERRAYTLLEAVTKERKPRRATVLLNDQQGRKGARKKAPQTPQGTEQWLLI